MNKLWASTWKSFPPNKDDLSCVLKVEGRSSVIETFKQLLAEEGVWVMTKGLSARIISSTPTSVLIVVGYETLKRLSLRADLVESRHWWKMRGNQDDLTAGLRDTDPVGNCCAAWLLPLDLGFNAVSRAQMPAFVFRRTGELRVLLPSFFLFVRPVTVECEDRKENNWLSRTWCTCRNVDPLKGQQRLLHCMPW